MKKYLLYSALACALWLSGCAMFDKPGGSELCPEAGFLAEGQVGVYVRDGAKADPENIISRAALVNYQGACTFKDGWTDVDMTVTLAAEAGPAGRDAPGQSYEWFSAVMDRSGNILQKKVFSTGVEFDKDGHGEANEEIRHLLPGKTPEDAAQYRIVFGLQLTKDQLAFNREGKPL